MQSVSTRSIVDHYPQNCPLNVTVKSIFWQYVTDIYIDPDTDKCKTSVDLSEYGVTSIRRKKGASPDSIQTVFLAMKINSVTWLKQRPSDKAHTLWAKVIPAHLKSEVLPGRPLHSGIRTTKKLALKSAKAKSETILKWYNDHIDRLKKAGEDVSEIQSWVKERDGYIVILRTLKRLESALN